MPFDFLTPHEPAELDGAFSLETPSTLSPLVMSLYPTLRGTDDDCFSSFVVGRIPFVPAVRDADFVGASGVSGNSRLEAVARRQLQFVSRLANVQSFHNCGFSLRYIVRPETPPIGASTATLPAVELEGRIDVVLIARVSRNLRSETLRGRGLRLDNERRARLLWRKLQVHFPTEEPFNYQLVPVNTHRDFLACFEPIPFWDVAPRQVLEVRKFVEVEFPQPSDAHTRPARLLSQSPNGATYYVHPFSPRLEDLGALGGLMSALDRQSRCTVLSISLCPTRLTTEELSAVSNLGQTVRRQLNVGTGGDGLPRSELDPLRRKRAEDAVASLERMLDHRDRLLTFRVQILAAGDAPPDVAEAIGAALVDSEHCDSWTLYQPCDESATNKAVIELAYVEHVTEDASGTVGAGSVDRLHRLAQLVTPVEATGAFRFPISPDGGYLAGIGVRDEPFVRTAVIPVADDATPAPQSASVSIGMIRHHGTLTDLPFRITDAAMERHVAIGGSTGSGKTNTCLVLLTSVWQLWATQGRQGGILILYPVDKPDYRPLMYDPRINRDLLVYTLGDEATVPFRFNPFAVPEGVQLRLHMTQLMRCFNTAFFMWDVLPSIFRKALRRCYLHAEWADSEAALLTVVGPGRRPPPTLSDFRTAISEAVEEEIGAVRTEYTQNIRHGSLSRINDLLHSAGHVLNTREPGPFSELLERPVLIEIGRIGDSEDIALIMAFLLLGLREELERRMQRLGARQLPPHLTLIEEAHRVMSAASATGGKEFQPDTRGKAAEEFSNLLAEVRGFGERIVLAEQMLSSLVPGAIANTHVKIMQWLESPNDFELFSQILNLTERQKRRARTLLQGEAIVRDEFGQPVHVQVPRYGHDLAADARARTWAGDVSDAAVREFMRRPGVPSIPSMVALDEAAPVERRYPRVPVRRRP